MNKYHAQKSIYDDMIWDSKLELDVYKWLCKAVRYQDSNVTLEVKTPVIVKPKCDTFRQRKWKCDFRLLADDNHINVEVKGFLTRDFIMMFEMFEACCPDEFNQTYILTDNKDVIRQFKNLGNRIIWLPSLTDSLVNPNNW